MQKHLKPARGTVFSVMGVAGAPNTGHFFFSSLTFPLLLT
jgi:hypothetical protein